MLPTHRSIASAREMRKNLTPPEARLWCALRGKALNGLRFRRQQPIGPFILDFYCHSARLGVEVDVMQHRFDDNPARDERRDLWLERHGLTVLRLQASDVRDNLDGVLALIEERARHAVVVACAPEGPFVALRATLPPRGEEKRLLNGDREMIGYVTIGALDFDTALPFYDSVFGAIGGERKSFEGGWAFYGPKDGEGNVGVCKPHDGQPARGGNGIMIAFVAPSQAAVAAAHAAGLAHGGTDEGAPGYRPPDGTSFYGAYVRDPAGNKLCVFHTG